MLPVLRRAVASVASNVPVSEDLLLTDRLAFHFRHVRAASAMLAALGGTAVVLSAIALYAVLALLVRQRSHEIAIRIALGARQSMVSGLVIRQGVSLCALGGAIGAAAAVPAARILRSILYGVSPDDPSIWLGVIGVLSVVATAACALPARRAARIRTVDALRGE